MGKRSHGKGTTVALSHLNAKEAAIMFQLISRKPTGAMKMMAKAINFVTLGLMILFLGGWGHASDEAGHTTQRHRSLVLLAQRQDDINSVNSDDNRTALPDDSATVISSLPQAKPSTVSPISPRRATSQEVKTRDAAVAASRAAAQKKGGCSNQD
jgi:hypothetical protein